MEKNQSNLVQSFIERDETNIIKGIAIVFMFIHHFFTLPAYWTVSVSKMYFGIDYTMFCSSFKICVPLFAFLTGYFYFYSKNKTLIYSVKKATDLWITYLFLFFCFFIVGMIMGVYEFAFPRFITEMFALTSRTMTHGWYVTFYVGTILLLPVYHKVSEKSDFLAFSLFVIIPHLCSYLFEITPLYDRAPYIKDFIEEFFYLQVVAIGYICSKYNILQRLYSILLTQKKILRWIIAILYIFVPFFLRSYSDAFDFIYAPIFIVGVLFVVKSIGIKWMFIPLSVLGKYSLLLWFLHCAYANQLKEFTQPILYYPRNPFLVTIWGLLLCTIAAAIIKMPIDSINKAKNRLLHLV